MDIYYFINEVKFRKNPHAYIAGVYNQKRAWIEGFDSIYRIKRDYAITDKKIAIISDFCLHFLTLALYVVFDLRGEAQSGFKADLSKSKF